MRVKWQDKITNSEILRRSRSSMNDTRLPKAVFYSELSNGKRKSGGQYLRFKDVLKRNLTSCNIPWSNWKRIATQMSKWRKLISEKCKTFEMKRLEHIDSKRYNKKIRPKPSYTYSYNNSGQLYCGSCNQIFKTKFGYASHIRAHSRR
ncbi:jg17162 [Pararge aegeria aegeria]|uniref:Jg17162 protein n=1 Tax=Pararge aegeria aegeria TaxID=348720 RepID=A0A8S4RNC2_9NEOP|nr:jg17162 [Pararge aegeria aegeria]